MTLLATIAWFIVMFTVIVVVHEAGHAGVARLFGVRVTEFFVGMPFGPSVSVRSRRSGIRYGVSVSLLGGYTRIAGMAHEPDERLPFVLAVVNARGSVTAAEMALVLGCDEEEAVYLLDGLAAWGSVEAVFGDTPSAKGSKGVPEAYCTPQRDPSGLTVYDRGHDFSLPGSTQAGEPFFPKLGPDAFFEAERARTYAGVGFFKRLCILVAGVACNVVLAFCIFMAYLTMYGVPAVASSAVSAVEPSSQAAELGIVAGDRITEVGGVEVGDYYAMASALEEVRGTGPFVLVYLHDGRHVTVEAELDEGETLGVSYALELRRLGVSEAFPLALSSIAQTGQAVADLLVPSKTADVLEQSAGVVGIATLTYDVVAAGGWSAVMLLASLSLSLGWMNLLPVPPLDGGKVLIEFVQALMGRPLSLRAQGALSLAGSALILLLFLFVLVQDISRIAAGSI